MVELFEDLCFPLKEFQIIPLYFTPKDEEFDNYRFRG
jgi:hypothetical protein